MMAMKSNPPEKITPPDTGEELDSSKTDRLWAPWRMKYIEAAARGEENGCFLCDNPKLEDSPQNLVLCRGHHCFVMMNLYPYNNGHLMVAPYRHIADLHQLTGEEWAEMGELIKLSLSALSETMHPHGHNIGLNLGRVAGAGIEDHLHLHIVPRWSGDTNFMPVIADTKVVSESLEEGWRRLRQAFKSKK
jgi:ATP adenylyltransferase